MAVSRHEARIVSTINGLRGTDSRQENRTANSIAAPRGTYPAAVAGRLAYAPTQSTARTHAEKLMPTGPSSNSQLAAAPKSRAAITNPATPKGKCFIDSILDSQNTHFVSQS